MNPSCTVPGCTKRARSATADLCKMHYHRKYRHGSVDKVGRGRALTVVKGRYRQARMPNHPLATVGGNVYEHRRVLYDLIGPGAHACHWCAATIVWELVEGDPARLHVDHLNGQRDDNRPENLVPSCKACNVARGAQARHRVLVDAGFWSSHDTIERLASRRRKAPLEAA